MKKVWNDRLQSDLDELFAGSKDVLQTFYEDCELSLYQLLHLLTEHSFDRLIYQRSTSTASRRHKKLLPQSISKPYGQHWPRRKIHALLTSLVSSCNKARLDDLHQVVCRFKKNLREIPKDFQKPENRQALFSVLLEFFFVHEMVRRCECRNFQELWNEVIALLQGVSCTMFETRKAKRKFRDEDDNSPPPASKPTKRQKFRWKYETQSEAQEPYPGTLDGESLQLRALILSWLDNKSNLSRIEQLESKFYLTKRFPLYIKTE